ncbi:MAG TPA: dTMP kinase [Pirellulales bacterium]
MFLSFEGIDGAGKTTQVRRLAERLIAEGRMVATCRDPGSTELGDAVRKIVLHEAVAQVGRTAEMLLYMAARAQMVEEVIRPALAAGKVVLSDRFLLSNVVYQGHAGGLDPQALWSVGAVACGGLLPDRTYVLDLEPEAGLARIDRPLDRMEREGLDFRRRLRAGFLLEAARQPERIEIVDAARDAETIHADLYERVLRRLAQTG